MRWESGRRSENVEDRRDETAEDGGGGPRVGMPIKLSGGAILLVAVLSLITGENPLRLLQGLEQSQEQAPVTRTAPRPGPGAPGGAAPGSDPQAEFVSVVLADTEDTWNQVFAAGN